MPKLGKTQMRILWILESHKTGIRVKQIWRELGDGVSYQAVKIALRRLRKAGLVSEGPLYQITEAGKKALSEAQDPFEISIRVKLLSAHIWALERLARAEGWVPCSELRRLGREYLDVLKHLERLGLVELERSRRGYRTRITYLGLQIAQSRARQNFSESLTVSMEVHG